MTEHTPDPSEHEPLDPAFEAVRRKMLRLLVVSMGVMFIGVAAVLGAVIWRVSGAGDVQQSTFELVVPKGFVVLSVNGTPDRITVFGTDASGQSRVLQFDADSGQMVVDGRITDVQLPKD